MIWNVYDQLSNRIRSEKFQNLVKVPHRNQFKVPRINQFKAPHRNQFKAPHRNQWLVKFMIIAFPSFCTERQNNCTLCAQG